ncbi:MAG: aldo/keto reductase [Pseudomonadota bacterium]|nr:aldo/keto reductase [Pseudomonadota bacterium]MED5385779.1 aldo/keto reductase [Pseudomonadota bacterium]MED5529678.1 aldo/keto reductase [Pseudomonadota bacterium]MEE3142937.1 aldo/keto reductase [Pseudomonadota bacterium]MEE3238463.1 aldo/keto reductase [Pseudomonadota bacterium]|tara:strand:- start:1776 stop:2687 length:912 start_codon:yes stop_codon:yes gene_type:complete
MKLTRRQVIQAGANLAGASLISPILAQSPLNTTIIPSSGQQVPSVGIGCRNYRGSLNSDEMPVFTDTLSTFHRLGGKVVDTSPNYGNSEEIIGTIMRELDIRNELWVATKVDREDQATGIARMERSFKLLAGDSFELMQVHNLRGVDIQLKTMTEWKEQGRFRYIGVTTSSDRQYEAMAEVMNRHTLDFIQIDYSLGNRNADDRLLPMALDKGIAVLVNLPFGRGRLFNAVGDTPLPDWATDIDAGSWAQIFLKYVMSHPTGAIPIPGTTKPHHADDNIAAARGRLPDASLRREMELFIDPLL